MCWKFHFIFFQVSLDLVTIAREAVFILIAAFWLVHFILNLYFGCRSHHLFSVQGHKDCDKSVSNLIFVLVAGGLHPLLLACHRVSQHWTIQLCSDLFHTSYLSPTASKNCRISVSNFIFVLISGAIPYFRSALESHSVKPDTSISLQCPVQPATARISWLFNGEELRSDSPRGVSIRGTELRIPSFKWRPDDRSHVGTYQCKAKTQKGTIVSNEATLTKAGKIFHSYSKGILPKGPYLPCVSMACRALLAGYPRFMVWPKTEVSLIQQQWRYLTIALNLHYYFQIFSQW